MTYRIAKFWSSWELCKGLWETSRADESISRRLQEQMKVSVGDYESS